MHHPKQSSQLMEHDDHRYGYGIFLIVPTWLWLSHLRTSIAKAYRI